jgi:hypothetical protein
VPGLLAEFIGYAVAHSEPPDSITVRVARAGKAARIEVVSEGVMQRAMTSRTSHPRQKSCGRWVAR